jgi:hypothetical protein
LDRFRSYQLRAIDFSSDLEACSYGLEDALRSTIDYVLWLHKNQKQIFPNAILIRALQEQCQPKAWRDDYLEPGTTNSLWVVQQPVIADPASGEFHLLLAIQIDQWQ